MRMNYGEGTANKGTRNHDRGTIRTSELQMKKIYDIAAKICMILETKCLVEKEQKTRQIMTARDLRVSLEHSSMKEPFCSTSWTSKGDREDKSDKE